MKRDLRAYAKQTNIQLGIAGLVLLFGVGIGLIYLIYGPRAALLGFVCLLAGLVPIGLVLFFLFGMDWIVKRARPK